VDEGQRALPKRYKSYLRVDDGQHAALQRVRLGDAGRVLPAEQVVLLDGLDEDQPHELAEVAAAELVLEGLEVRAQVHEVEVVVPARHRQDALAEHAHFGVDQHVLGLVVPGLRPHPELLLVEDGDGEHGCCVEAGAENECEASGWVDVCARKECR